MYTVVLIYSVKKRLVFCLHKAVFCHCLHTIKMAAENENPQNSQPPECGFRPNNRHLRAVCDGNGASSPTPVWQDITQPFLEAVRDLSLGELLHDSMFGLFEAMSAIEMMDPKMDAGVTRDLIRPPVTYDQLVESGALKLDGLVPKEIIGIIDATLACLVSWLEGHSLAQTVFTNLYLHRPQQIQNRTMKAVAISFHKIIDLIKDFVNKALVFEEEDFQTMNYGFKLTPEGADSKAIAGLREIEDDLHKKIRLKSDEIQHEDLVALHARIRFLRQWHQALVSFSKGREAVANGESLRLITACAELLATPIRRSSHRGLGADSNSGEFSTPMPMLGFDPLVNQRLLPPTFPRYTKVKSRQAAFDYLEELLARLKVVCRVTSLNTFPAALEFFMEFSRHGPCILTRSILQCLYLPLANTYSPHSFKSFGSESCVEVLKEAAKNFISPPVLQPKSPLLSNTQARDYVDTFLSHCVRPFGSLLQLCGHNRARQRDKLAHLLEDLAALQDEAERVDAFLHTLALKMDITRPHLACFGTWVLYYTLRVMIMYLLSGLELELYSTHEYHYIFWYLYEFLYGWLVSALSRANSHMMEQEAVEAHRGGRTTKKAKPKRKKSQPFGREMTVNQALQNMCGGYYKAMSAFRLEGKMPCVHPEFDNEQVRYEHRFAAFAQLVTPPPVQYAEFRATAVAFTHNQSHAHQLYLDGCKHFHHARTLLENLSAALSTKEVGGGPGATGMPPAAHDQEIQDLILICKTNFVVLKLLADGHKKDSKTPPDFDFKNHPHFPIIRLV